MATGHRYRLLIYFAALVLCLSVCFAYAEEPASIPSSALSSDVLLPSLAIPVAAPSTTHLLFNTTPGRSSFLPTLAITLTLAAPSDDSSETPYADAALHALTLHSNKSHGFAHGLFSSRHKLKLVTAHAQQNLSPVGNSETADGSEQQ